MKIAILGTGAYSLAIAYALSKNNHEIILWSHDALLEEEFNKTKKLKSIIDFEMSDNITITTSLEICLNKSKLIFVATASKFFTSLLENIKPYYNKNTPICIATKGIDDNSKEFLSNIAKRVLKTKHISVLSGPTFAIDIIQNEPVALALASKSNETIKTIKKALCSNRLKLRANNDLIGVQICGSVKNVIAIAAGILNGLGYSNSTTAFLINESMHDIKNAMRYLGAKKSTILSFAGIGDLILTCTSTKSRNFSFGYTIGKFNNEKTTKIFLEENTVEGYYALTSFRKLLKKHQVKFPLINIINDIVINNENPEKLVKFLITKD